MKTVSRPFSSCFGSFWSIKINFSLTHIILLLLEWHLFWHDCVKTQRFSHIKLKQNRTVPWTWPEIHLKLSLFIPINRKGWDYLVPMQTRQCNCCIQSELKMRVVADQTHMSKGTVKRFPKIKWVSYVFNEWHLQSKYSGGETDLNIWIVQHTAHSAFNNLCSQQHQIISESAPQTNSRNLITHLVTHIILHTTSITGAFLQLGSTHARITTANQIVDNARNPWRKSFTLSVLKLPKYTYHKNWVNIRFVCPVWCKSLNQFDFIPPGWTSIYHYVWLRFQISSVQLIATLFAYMT